MWIGENWRDWYEVCNIQALNTRYTLYEIYLATFVLTARRVCRTCRFSQSHRQILGHFLLYAVFGVLDKVHEHTTAIFTRTCRCA